MKKLYIVGGTMGVGKTAVCRNMEQKLPSCVFLDGDWCWDMHPFTVNDETKKMVMENICILLNQFIHCKSYENIVFCWVMHEQKIIDEILGNLDISECEVKTVSLICSESTLRARLEGDVNAGIRTEDVIERSIARIPLYEKLDTIKVRTDGLDIDEIARNIIEMK